MNIGIIVYSQTGNTYSVVGRLKEELSEQGHQVSIEKLEPVNKDDVNPRAKDIKYKNLPDLKQYEAYIFASPVQAFSLSAGMKSYLEQMDTLDNKKTFCFVTKGLPFNWTGGTKALKQFKNLLESKNANFVESDIIKWSTNKEKDITSMIENVKKLFKLEV